MLKYVAPFAIFGFLTFTAYVTYGTETGKESLSALGAATVTQGLAMQPNGAAMIEKNLSSQRNG